MASYQSRSVRLAPRRAVGWDGWDHPGVGQGSGVCEASCPPHNLHLSSHPHTQTEFRECDYSKFMSVLDADKDGEVDFVEYVRSLACLCTYCHEYFKDCPPGPSCPQ